MKKTDSHSNWLFLPLLFLFLLTVPPTEGLPQQGAKKEKPPPPTRPSNPVATPLHQGMHLKHKIKTLKLDKSSVEKRAKPTTTSPPPPKHYNQASGSGPFPSQKATDPSSSFDELSKELDRVKKQLQAHSTPKRSLWDKIILVIIHPRVMRMVNTLLAHSNIYLLWLLEVTAFILLFIVKGKQLVPETSFERYLWTEIWIFSLGMAVMGFIIPFSVFRSDFTDLLSTLTTQFLRIFI